MNLIFLEAPSFERWLPNYLNDDEYVELQKFLLQKPEAGDVIQGTGGFRKLRWRDSRRSKGKRGGLRIIYYYFDSLGVIYFAMISNKNEATDLSSEQKRQLRLMIEVEKEVKRGN
jgi:mRNA-degrading endonuclease RelE of RelBE toxin-antitoxin system